MTNDQIIGGIILIIITAIFGIISWLIKEKIKTMEKDISDIEGDISEVKTDIKNIRQNYLDKFDDVKSLITEKHEETMKAMAIIDKNTAEQVAFCKAIQKFGKE